MDNDPSPIARRPLTVSAGLSPVGVALRRFRRSSGLSQEAVAETLGVHQSMVSKWETGREGPSFGNERAILRLVGEKPVSQQIDGLVDAVLAMKLSAGVFDRDGQPVAESAMRFAWTAGAALADLLTAPDNANLARYGGLPGVLAHPDLTFSYHRRRTYTGEHTLCTVQNITLGSVALTMVMVYPLQTTAVDVCGTCQGYGTASAERPTKVCGCCGGYGYFPPAGSLGGQP